MGADAIYFISSIFVLWKFVSRRRWMSFSRMFTIVNPNIRIANGLSMFEMESELRYYEISVQTEVPLL